MSTDLHIKLFGIFYYWFPCLLIQFIGTGFVLEKLQSHVTVRQRRRVSFHKLTCFHQKVLCLHFLCLHFLCSVSGRQFFIKHDCIITDKRISHNFQWGRFPFMFCLWASSYFDTNNSYSQDVHFVNLKSLDVPANSPKSRLYRASLLMPTAVASKVFWDKNFFFFFFFNYSNSKTVDGMPRKVMKSPSL